MIIRPPSPIRLNIVGGFGKNDQTVGKKDRSPYLFWNMILFMRKYLDSLGFLAHTPKTVVTVILFYKSQTFIFYLVTYFISQ